MSRDRKIIFVLLVALAVQTLLLLMHTGVIQIGRSNSFEGKRAGQIRTAHNHLRRRNVNSLVWEDSQVQEPVMYYDSLLTLKESTAVLDLDTSNEVTLSENTLITVEPPGDEQGGEIRLRFVRGNLQARNPFREQKILGDSWAVDLKSGSEVELRETGEGEVEVRLNQGEAVVNAKDGAKNLGPNQILRVNRSGSNQYAIDPNLKWVNPPAKRTYLHGDAVPTQIEWNGGAEELVVQTLGRGEKIIPVAGRSGYVADLDYGHHRFTLRTGNRASNPLDVQVWRAPLIHLLQPLPRNRVDLRQEVRFLWQKPAQIPGFNLRMSGGTTQIAQRQNENKFVNSFNREEDLQWYVEGIDAEGFTIPPLYRYPLFIREKPLPAPKLRLPQLRMPANEPKKPPGPGAWLWRQIFPSAHADSKVKFEAVFSWDPVPGANQYVIEISETADFRNPIVNKTSPSVEFTWTDFQLQTYYWRVAAGHSTGRMGVFSEPVSLDLSPLKKNPSIVALDGVMIRKVEQKPVEPAPTPPPAVEAPKPIEPAAIVLTEAQKSWRPIALWQPKYGSMQVNGTENSKATLPGATMPSFGFEYPWMLPGGEMMFFDFTVAYFAFKPEPKETYPFQKDLAWLEFDATALFYRSALGYGFTARQVISVRRTDYESIESDTVLGFGPSVAYNVPLSRGDLNLRGGIFVNRDGQGLSGAAEWRGKIGERFTTGLGLEGVLLLDLPDTGYSFQGFATVGFPF